MSKLICVDGGVEQGMQYVQAELAAKRSAVYLGSGPAGGALLVGSLRTFESGGGAIIALSLTPVQLIALRDRCNELLPAAVQG